MIEDSIERSEPVEVERTAEDNNCSLADNRQENNCYKALLIPPFYSNNTAEFPLKNPMNHTKHRQRL